MSVGKPKSDTRDIATDPTGNFANQREYHEKLLDCAQQNATPFLFSRPHIAARNAARLGRQLTRAKIYYAVKCNDSPSILTKLAQTVTGFEIASAGELLHLRDLGINNKNILFSNPVKLSSDIAKSYELGVRYYAFDCMDEIRKLAVHAPGSNVYIRIQVPDSGSSFPLSSKFGATIPNALNLCRRARSHGLRPVGIAFHVGSQTLNPESWRRAIEIAGQLIRDLAQNNIYIQMLDIGGGFPALNPETNTIIDRITDTINASLDEHIDPSIEIITEPGRFIVADSASIVTQVLAREQRGDKDWLHLDMGAFQGLMEPLEMPGWKYPITTTRTSNRNIPYVLTGPTCDPYDTIGHDYLLPHDVAAGDNLFIHSVGAYSTVYSTSFNGFMPPLELVDQEVI